MKKISPSKRSVAIGERMRIAKLALKEARGWHQYAKEMKEITAWDSMERGIGAEHALRRFAAMLKGTD
jgi:hypothetical protein